MHVQYSVLMVKLRELDKVSYEWLQCALQALQSPRTPMHGEQKSSDDPRE
jgi:hypothetical protein